MTGAAAVPAPLVVSGAGGWIGSALLREAAVRGLVANATGRLAPGGPFDASLLRDAVVVHLAAIAHRDPAKVSDGECRAVNRDLAVDFATAARNAGARRFVLVSTAAVMGVRSVQPWTESDPVQPADAYARAKLEAERGVLPLHRPGRFEVCVLRPPLVWGPGVRANFRSLLDAAAGGRPLPLASARAPRSMVHLDTLIDALLFVAQAPAAGGRTFFVRDEIELSVSQWITTIRVRLGLPPRIWPLGSVAFRAAAELAGRSQMHSKLFEPAQVDDGALRALGWRSPLRFDDALDALLGWHAADAGPKVAPGPGACGDGAGLRPRPHRTERPAVDP
jgi:nucleoside-diphosphate-sugar epimerase